MNAKIYFIMGAVNQLKDLEIKAFFKIIDCRI